jgi:hypothetical protein
MDSPAFPQELLNLVVQFPILAFFYFIWKQQIDAHKESIAYYRDQQRQLSEWMRRMIEVWSGEQLDLIAVQQKKIRAAQTPTDESR